MNALSSLVNYIVSGFRSSLNHVLHQLICGIIYGLEVKFMRGGDLGNHLINVRRVEVTWQKHKSAGLRKTDHTSIKNHLAMARRISIGDALQLSLSVSSLL